MIDKYGLKPEQIIDMKGLMGDSADNIPGVPGIGEKTAVKILTAFPTVEAAYEHLEEVEPKRAMRIASCKSGTCQAKQATCHDQNRL